MEQENVLLTVFRSAESSAEEECAEIRSFLAENSIEATVAGDDAPGVVAGCFEVRVAAADADQATAIIASMPDEAEPADPSHSRDLVSIYRADASSGAEMEAMGLKAILESNEIPAFVVGGSMMPNLPVEVRVASADEERARAVIADAAAAGPEAAEEAELQTETPA